jgi:hypothetical protein
MFLLLPAQQARCRAVFRPSTNDRKAASEVDQVPSSWMVYVMEIRKLDG